ncbi:hypothetical protein TIFTF001_014058 [Ficus carica]|uniref:Uncharacterized protein n=1 Tax=Ficus carica TaxID=3494 RepID=A0AA88D7U3_FICCA|nr:hypothetical protein TIFTF001_014058 [Ficus carica]
MSEKELKADYCWRTSVELKASTKAWSRLVVFCRVLPKPHKLFCPFTRSYKVASEQVTMTLVRSRE